MSNKPIDRNEFNWTIRILEGFTDCISRANRLFL